MRRMARGLVRRMARVLMRRLACGVLMPGVGRRDAWRAAW